MKISPLAVIRLELAFTLLILAGGAALLSLAFVRVSLHVIEVKKTLLTIEENVRTLESYRRQAINAQKLLETRSEDIARVQALQIDPERPLNFIQQVEALAEKTKTLVTLDAQSLSAGSKGLSLRATIEGTDARARAMLGLLTLLPYRVDIQNIFFQRVENKDAPIRITVPFLITPL